MGGTATVTPNQNTLIAAARDAATRAYAPYSDFHVGAALAFADGSVVTGSNVEDGAAEAFERFILAAR